ncbi:microtubule-associated protein EB1 [Tieghemostelium lacteum]|uniref:Microtubule-associated protein EB1 n=1 Tax=Tieghemostelium lacteum TaxID=361077 RepID=A0A152A590_TIELA|nr:microtubule-associated protein EB1 [Tieghemostelium lacteum]|eukprot:KYR01247.1 microtubule-associated protein EB1 [Tieghemostelium lacteum]
MECGRNEIINWINDILQLSYTKIEQTCTGAAHCQLIDIIFPGKIALARVNYTAKYDYEYIKNFSYLQESFAKLGIEKPIEVSEMVKGKPQANLEFCQWMKKFFDQHYNPEVPYNALERRVQLKINADTDKALMAQLGIKAGGSSAPRPSISKPSAAATTAAVSKPVASTTKPTAAVTKPASTITKPTATTTKPAVSKPTASVSKPALATVGGAKKPATTTTTAKPTATTTSKPVATKPTTTSTTTTASTGISKPAKATSPTPELSAMNLALKKQIEDKDALINEMNNDIEKLKVTIQEIETDRNFYFDTLIEVETYCQNNEVEHNILQNILNIIYAKNNDGEGEANQTQPQEEGTEEHEEIQEEQVEEQQEEEQEEEQQEEEHEVNDLNEEDIIAQHTKEDEDILNDFNGDDSILEEEEI